MSRNRFGERLLPRRDREPMAPGRRWTPDQWAEICRCARVAKGERSGMTPLTAGRALREYAKAAEESAA